MDSNPNPYQAPHTEPPEHRPDDIPGYLRHRVFRRPRFFTWEWSAKRMMNGIRDDAEAFVNSHVGVDNVVAVNEIVGFDYSVTVWYRTRSSRSDT